MSTTNKLICHINLAKSFRGGERQTELLIRGLSGAGLQQRLVYRNNAPLGNRIGNVAGLQLAPVSGLLTAARACKAAALIHAHEGRGVYAALLRKLVSGSPYVITRRVSKSPGDGWITRAAYRRAAQLVAISAAVADGLRQLDPDLEPAIVPSATSGLVQSAQGVIELRQRFPGRFVVGHIGALDHATKGQIHLIRVARRLSQTHPEILFALVGSGPDEARMRKESAGLENVWMAGFADNVGDFLSWFDVFAFPSYTEGLGSIVLDAMQFGLPVIASRVGGLPEIVRDDETGLLIAVGDEDALQNSIIKLFEDDALRSRLAEHGQRYAAGYSPQHMVGRYRKIYDSVLGAADEGPG